MRLVLVESIRATLAGTLIVGDSLFCHVGVGGKQARFFSCGGKSKANSCGGKSKAGSFFSCDGKSKADSFVSHVAVKAKSGLVNSLCDGKGKADPFLKCGGTSKAGSYFLLRWKEQSKLKWW